MNAFPQSLRTDTTYIEDHTKDLTVRIFGGYSFLGYKLDEKGFSEPLTYKANNNFNVGVGFNYRFIGLNLDVKAPFVNNDNGRFGTTRSVDLQSYFYMRRYTLDVYGQFYQGYYVKSSDILTVPLPKDHDMLRPDLRTSSIGFNAQYIFNYKKFSYRAAYMQNEYQRASAGSVIAGIGIHHFAVSADSAVIPSQIKEQGFFNNSRFDRSQIFATAVNGGYVYTVVIHRNYFITGALMSGLGINITSLTDDELHTKERNSGLQLNGSLRLSTGYNSSIYFVGVQYIGFLSRSATPIVGSWQEFDIGNFKVTLAKRFGVKKNVIKEVYKQVLPNDKTLEKLHLDGKGN